MSTLGHIGLGLACFIIAALLDYADTAHKIAVERRQYRAAFYSVAMYLLGLVGLVALFDVSKWFIVPESLGLLLGSTIAIRQARSKARRARHKRRVKRKVANR